MPERPDYRLTFMLPPVLRLVPVGRHHPCIAGAMLAVAADLLVTVTGTSRALVFEQARRWLRVHAKGHGPLAIAAVLYSAMGMDRFGRPFGGSDTWTIIIEAEIAFAPTSIPPDLGIGLSSGDEEHVFSQRAATTR